MLCFTHVVDEDQSDIAGAVVRTARRMPHRGPPTGKASIQYAVLPQTHMQDHRPIMEPLVRSIVS